MNVRRQDTLDDFRGAREVHNRTWRVGFRGMVSEAAIESQLRPTDEDALQSLREEIASEPGYYGVAEVDGSIVGFVRARYGGTSEFVEGIGGEIVDLTVDPAHWRNGIGSTLLGAAIDGLPPMIDGISAQVLADNDRGRSFLEANGLVHEESQDATIGDESYSHVIYRVGLEE
ncbi:GNAT family N-acetyltransferase [Salinarchaeum laminariae]|uniref:GNAT family N-acetyltransferase n=1 Tax=Salinarchaeum laminariae TaxID=869888 RepID=UPI0020C04403|nr:GNAT family N-acetyltransferase [Salinarchaeum laminariae]